MNFQISYKVVSPIVAVKNFFNNLDNQKLVGLVKLGLDENGVSGNVTASIEVGSPLSKENNQPLIEKPDGRSSGTSVRENARSKPSLGEKPTSSLGLKGVSKSNDALHSISGGRTLPRAKFKENVVDKVSTIKQKSSTKLSHGSRDGSQMRENAKTEGNMATEKTILRSKVDSLKGGCEVVGILDGQMNKGLVKDKAFEKEKYGGSSKVSSTKTKNKVQNQRNHDDDVKGVAPSSLKDTYKLQRKKDICDMEEVPSKKLKIDTKPTKLSSDKLRKESSTISPNLEHKLDCRVTEVTQKPDVVSCNASTLTLSC